MLEAPGEVRFLLGQVTALILLLSAVEKLLRPRHEFWEILHQHRVIPTKMQGLVAGLVPAVELTLGFLGLALSWSRLHVFAMSGIASLYALYAIYLGILAYTGRRADCGCVSATLSETEPVEAAHIMRAMVLCLFALTAVRPSAPPSGVAILVTFMTSSSAAFVTIMLPTLLRVEKVVAPMLTDARRDIR
jgi:hypothetical protein